MSRRTSSILVALLAPLLAVGMASAQPKGSKEKEKAAKAYVDAGLAAQERGDQDTAIAMYAKAYELVPVPILVFNMAQAHRLAGRTQQALDHYKRYLADEPKGAKAKTAREFITALEGQLVMEEAARARAAREADEARKAEEVRKAEEARQAEEARKAREADDARRAGGGGKKPPGDGRIAPIGDGEEEDGEGEGQGEDEGGDDRGGGGGLRKVGLTSAALGVVSLGVSIPFALEARSISDELSTPGTTYDADKDARGKQAAQIHLITTVAGGVLLAGGVTMYVIGRSKKNDGVAFTPVIDPDHVGIVVRGAY